MRLLVPAMLVLLLGGSTLPASAASQKARIRRPEPAKRVRELELLGDSLEVQIDRSQATPVAFVILSGHYPHPERSLLVQSTALTLRADGGFAHPIVLTSPEQSIEIRAIDKRGEIESEQVLLEFAELAALQKGNEMPMSTPERTELLTFDLNLGVKLLEYSQTHFAKTFQATPLLKGSYLSKPTPGGFFWDASLFCGFPQGSLSLWLVGGNIRGGVPLSWPKAPWTLVFFGEYAFVTTFSSQPQPVGFQNLSSPRIYPALRTILPNGDRGELYFKYSPVLDRLQLLSLSSREAVVGLSYGFQRSRKSQISIAAELAQLDLEKDDRSVSSSSLTLSVGYGF